MNPANAWQSFADSANWAHLHSLDLDRFATFVSLSIRSGNSAPDFEALIIDHVSNTEMRADVVTRLDDLYDFAQRLL